MTGSYRLSGHHTFFSQLGRWLTLATLLVGGAFLLFFSAAFALILLGAIAFVGFVSFAVFWLKAKITGKPFGPRAQMEAQMEEFRRQMGANASPFNARSGGKSDDGPVIDAHETPEGWTVER